MSKLASELWSATKACVRAVPGDLADLTTPQKLGMTLFAILSVTFSIIDFNSIIFPNRGLSPLKWVNDTNAGHATWQRVLMTFSAVASFSGVMAVVLTTLGRFSNYTWGLINAVAYGLAALAYSYAGDFQLNIIYFAPMQFVGILTWSRNLNADTHDAKSKSLTWVQRLVVLVVMGAMAAALFYEIPAFSTALTGAYYYADSDVPHSLDAIAVALQVAAQILMTMCVWEQWILWIAADVVQIIMFSGAIAVNSFDFNICVMWSLFLINALVGLYVWFRKAHSGAIRLAGDEESAGAGAAAEEASGSTLMPDQTVVSKESSS
ncbi:nicotinamide mononucleotide transporter-domain-containing protein [Blastocladiella britannica]|nr:nicotinamide mononucleotide transporter-domain-containing protein [Blastocladiella britannica]